MTKQKFGIFFPENTGYLYSRKLQPGVEGAVSLVCSVADGKQYVRKKTIPRLRPNTKIPTEEVRFHRSHQFIPELTWFKDYRVLKHGHKQRNKLKSAVMISKFCNGGDLDRFHNLFLNIGGLAEVVVWRMLDQRLRTLLFLHSSGVSNLDNHMGNVFLDFKEGAKLPDFCTADFGSAEATPSGIWAEEFTGFRKLKEIEDQDDDGYLKFTLFNSFWTDIATLSTNLSMMMFSWAGDDGDDGDVNSNKDHYKKIGRWSDALFSCQSALQNIADNFMKFPSTSYNKLEALSDLIAQHANEALKNDTTTDVSWTRPERYGWPEDFAESIENDKEPKPPRGYTGPMLFDSRYELLKSTRSIPGPWRIARLDSESLRVLGVERYTYNKTLPRLKDDPEDYSNDWSEEYESQFELEEWVDEAGFNNLLDTSLNWSLESRLLERVGGNLNSHRIFGLDLKWKEKRLYSSAEENPILTALSDRSKHLIHPAQLYAVSGVIVEQSAVPQHCPQCDWNDAIVVAHDEEYRMNQTY